MARSASSVPGVISRSLLESKAAEQGVGRLEQMQELGLQSLNLVKIDHLWMFERLTVLRLTGNMIEKLENLDALTSLVELNVSFNRLSRIEGLARLVRLRRLLVHANQIGRLEGLDTLRALTLLSAGHNPIAERSDVLYLRRLPLLRALSLQGTPLSKSEDYAQFTTALLPSLRFLDHKLIVQQPRDTEEYRLELRRVQEGEAAAARVAEEARAAEQRSEMLRLAFVHALDGAVLARSAGPRWAAVLEVGGETAQAMQREHVEQVQKVCESLRELALDRLRGRQQEEALFRERWHQACRANHAQCVRFVEEFLSPKETTYRTLRSQLHLAEQARLSGDDVGAGRAMQVAHREAQGVVQRAQELWSLLMGQEVELQEHLQELSEEFENCASALASKFIEEARTLLLRVRELEAQFHARLEHPCHVRADNLRLQTLGKDPPTLSLPAKELLTDTGLLAEWQREAHETRVTAIRTSETDLESSAHAWLASLSADLTQEAFKRSRARVLEITNFLEMQRREASDLQPSSLAYMGLL